MVSFLVRHLSDTDLSGQRSLASRGMGNDGGISFPSLKRYGISTSYEIDESNGSARRSVSVVFPGSKYSALDYTPARTGYRFLGWYSAASGGTKVESGDDVVFGQSPIYAQWQHHVTVTFDATTNGGAMPSGWVAPYYFAWQPYGTLPIPTHPSLNFSGWYDGSGNRISTSSIVPQNGATLTAQYVNSTFSVDLNGEWREQSPNTNPDPSSYAGVYESFSNWHSSGDIATMSIRIIGYSRFSFYMRSYAESSYDYCWCEAPTGSLVADMSPEEIEARKKIADYKAQGYNVEEYDEGDGYVYVDVYDENWEWVDGFSFPYTNADSTKGEQSGDTSISGYKLVTYDFEDASDNMIYIHFEKDGSENENDDRGYVLIPYVQETA